MPAMLFLDKRHALERLVFMSVRVHVPVEFLVETADPSPASQPLAHRGEVDLGSTDAVTASWRSLQEASFVTEDPSPRVGVFAGVGPAA